MIIKYKSTKNKESFDFLQPKPKAKLRDESIAEEEEDEAVDELKNENETPSNYEKIDVEKKESGEEEIEKKDAEESEEESEEE